jgi:hypothetical protein
MNEEPRRKKRSEKLSDSLVVRLARESGPSARSDGLATRQKSESDRGALAKMGAQQAHSFTRCPHCREYVPIRDTCRACGTPIN